MRSALILVVTGSWLFTSGTVVAQDSNAGAQASKRVLADCMLKRMSAEKSLSYNDATKQCKEQIKSGKPVTAANTVGKPVG